MKIKGEKLSPVNEETLVFPRSSGPDIVIKVRSVVDYKEFETQFPMPEPPNIMRRGETKATPDLQDPKYKAAVAERFEQRMAWMTLKSLEATEGLEWETVDPKEPDTWKNIDQELQDSGFNRFEVIAITTAIMQVNALDENYLAKARERFFASESQKEKKDQALLSPTDAQ